MRAGQRPAPALIRSSLPWWVRPLGVVRLEGYAGLPGTAAFERLRSRDRTYFIACLCAAPQVRVEPARRRLDQAA